MNDEPEFDPEYDQPPSFMLGACHALRDFPRKARRPVKRRPIGFTADIDTFIEDESP